MLCVSAYVVEASPWFMVDTFPSQMKSSILVYAWMPHVVPEVPSANEFPKQLLPLNS